ncbi:MAG: caspase family protein [Saprospiraceae bacterium]
MKKTLLLALCLLALTLKAQKPDLVLPTIHSSIVKGTCFSADSRFMATHAGSEIKMWDVKSGRLLRTIPSPSCEIGDIALSKDGSRLVCITLCDKNSIGEEGDEYQVDTEVQVWDMVAGKKLHTLIAFKSTLFYHEFAGYAHQYKVGISDDGNWATASYEETTALWDTRSGREKWKSEYLGTGKCSPDGQHLVFVRQDTVVNLVNTADGAKTEILQDGCSLFAFQGDNVVMLTQGKVLKRWNTRRKSFLEDVILPEEFFPHDMLWAKLSFSQDGNRLGRGYEVDSNGDEKNRATSSLLQSVFFDVNTGLPVSRDTLEVEGGCDFFLTPDFQYYLTKPAQVSVDRVEVIAGMAAYSISTGAFSHYFGLKQLESTTEANFNRCDDACRVYTVYNEGRMILIDRSGAEYHDAPSTLFFTEEGRLINGPKDSLMNFAENQTVQIDHRWKLESPDNLSYQLIDTKTNRLVATLLLVDADPNYYYEGYDTDTIRTSSIWAVTTPSGLFDASPEMMDNLHYVVGLDVIELSQLKERYYEPGLLSKIMGLSQETTRSVEDFNSVALYPDMTAQVSEHKLLVNLVPRDGGIGKLSLFVNGKEVLEDANPKRAQTIAVDLAPFANYYLPRENNILSLRVYNQAGWLKSAALELNYQSPATLTRTNPALYAIVVGTSNYASDKLDLTYADLDAAYFRQALQAAAPGVYADKVAITLLNTQADAPNRQGVSSKAAIRQAFADLVGKAKAQDVLVVYFSGHGISYGTAENAQFYYLTKDIASENLSDPEIRNNYAISSAELIKWINAIPALKQVMILDACNSGKIVEDLAASSKDLNSSQIRALDRMKDRTGMFILTGSAADKVSYEAGQYGQGLLTYSLLQGMSGLALTEDKRVDVMTLFQYSRDRVPELAKGIRGIQTPILAFPNNGASFDIGIVDGQVKIPLAQVKPVFIRNVFQDEVELDDVIGLTDALEKHFRELTAKGAQADIIFVDVKEYENAYSFKGLYSVKGDEVVVRVRLRKGKTQVGEEFTVTGKKSDLPALVEAILEKGVK